MHLILEVLLFLLYFCYSDNIIPINNLEKFFLLTNDNNSAIFSYSHQGSENEKNYVHTIRRNYFGSEFMKHSLNIYDNITLIKRVISGGYAKPKWSATLEGKDDYFEFEDSHSLNKTYYFIIENWQKSEYEFNITFTIYSTETLTNISSIVQAYLNTYKYTENLTYKFQVPLKHKKYLLIRFDTSNDNYEGNFIIYENGETLISNYSVTNNENYIELKSNSYYIINFFLIKIHKLGEGAYLFLAQSEYNRYMPVEINTDYFEEYPFKKTYIFY